MKVTPKDIAKEFGISDKRVRRVMRSLTDERAGHGGTWDMDSESEFVAELRFRLAIGGRSVKVTPTLKAQVVATVTEILSAPNSAQQAEILQIDSAELAAEIDSLDDDSDDS